MCVCELVAVSNDRSYGYSCPGSSLVGEEEEEEKSMLLQHAAVVQPGRARLGQVSSAVHELPLGALSTTTELHVD